jgi:hypothetical protein
MQPNYFKLYQYFQRGSRKPVFGSISEISVKKNLVQMTSGASRVTVFFTKNRTTYRFVTSGAHVSQVVWPVNRVCKICDLSAHAEQIMWPPVSFTLGDEERQRQGWAGICAEDEEAAVVDNSSNVVALSKSFKGVCTQAGLDTRPSSLHLKLNKQTRSCCRCPLNQSIQVVNKTTRYRLNEE